MPFLGASGGARRVLKRARSSPRLNGLLTSAGRAAFRFAGRDSEPVVRHLYRVGEVRCPLPDGRELRLWSLGDDHIPNQLFWRGWPGFEPETVPVYYRLAQRADVTIDVGAHVGVMTLLAAFANPSASVYAFEPMPTVRKRLAENIGRNGVTNVEIVGEALSDHRGSADLYAHGGGLPTTSSLARDFQFLGANDVERIEVPLNTLDSFVIERGIERVGLVKIDTESTEADVLGGARQVIARDRPAILCEVLPSGASTDELDAIVSELGYSRYQLTPGGPVLRERIEPDWHGSNYVFIPEGEGTPPPLERW